MGSFNYIRNSSKDIYKPNSSYTPQQGTIVVNKDTVLNIVLEEAGVNVTVNIAWHAAPAPIILYVNGVEYYAYETSAGKTTAHTHLIPKDSVISFHSGSSKGGSYVSPINGNPTTTATPDVSLYQVGSAYLVNSDCSFYVWSSIEPS